MTGATELTEAGQPGPPGIVLSSDGLGLGAEAVRLAAAIDPLRRNAAPDHLTVGCAARMLEALAAEIEQLRLAENGAAEAFGHVVQQKLDAEAECKRLRELLDGAHASIRRMSKLRGEA